MTNQPRPKWTSLASADRVDIERIRAAEAEWAMRLPDRLLVHLELLRGRGDEPAGMPVDRLEHSLQCATRAYRDSRSDEYVACALLHDIGDVLMPYNHAAIAASVVRPFVGERLHWMVEKHALFQGYYFFHHLGFDRDARDCHLGHPWYDDVAEFCERFDQCSFDPRYDSLPLEFFAVCLRDVFSPSRVAADPAAGFTSSEVANLVRCGA